MLATARPLLSFPRLQDARGELSTDLFHRLSVEIDEGDVRSGVESILAKTCARYLDRNVSRNVERNDVKLDLRHGLLQVKESVR